MIHKRLEMVMVNTCAAIDVPFYIRQEKTREDEGEKKKGSGIHI
jgi:hypothetical protein